MRTARGVVKQSNFQIFLFLLLFFYNLHQLLDLSSLSERKAEITEICEQEEKLQSYYSSFSLSTSPSLSSRVNQTQRFALVRPFVDKDFLQLLADIARWNQSDFFPCKQPKLKREIDLIFYYAYNLSTNPHMKWLLESVFHGNHWKSCFRAIHVIDSNLNKKQEGYLGDGAGVVSGPVVMFFNIFEEKFFTTNYDYFMLMEPDTNAVRREWLDKIYEECFYVPHDFWMKGTILNGPKFAPPRNKQESYLYHINGNALYNLRDRTFAEFLSQVKKIEGVGNAFDVSIHVHRWKNFYQTAKYAHKFVFTNTIRHYHVSGYSIKKFREQWPKGFVVHKKIGCDVCDPITPDEP